MSSITLPMLDLPEGSLQRQLGTLLLQKAGQQLSLPLQEVDIRAKVLDRVAEVTIKQVFRNSYNEFLEAVYIFPMAAGTAVSNFNMQVGERKIKGIVQERAEARRQYQQAVSDGKRAALLEQERDDIFTVQVGNLPPGEEVTIEITYSERLPFFEDGKSELRLPLVVAPRYIPGSELNRDQVGDGIESDTDQVSDASRISPPRLAQGVDPGTALKLSVEILADEDGEVEDLACSQHATRTGISKDGITISLAKSNERLNRDFVLRWTSTAAGAVKSSLSTFTADDGQTYGMLSIMPPRRSGYLGVPRDVVFVVDRSGSMQGIKMSSAVRACSLLLNTLGPQDRFAIAAFAYGVEWMPVDRGTQFSRADLAGIEKGEKFLRDIHADGGTEMYKALDETFDALKNRQNLEGRMPAIVVLTDGDVGNESAIMQQIQMRIGDARLFAVGIDTAVNAGLLKRLANLGGGTATFVEPGVQLEEALASVSREIGVPLVTDIQVENLELEIDRASLSPARIPDIFQGRASLAFFKLSGKGKLMVRGKLADGKIFEEKVRAKKVQLPAIAQLWAKAFIVDLEDQFRISQNEKAVLKKQIVDLAVKHQLLTKFTAFVVVDESEIVNNTGEVHKVVQAVEAPEAWDMAIPGQSAAAPATSSYGELQMQQACFEQVGSLQPPSAPQQAPSSPSPRPQPSPQAQPPFGGQSGSYGMGVRQQVFEVVVRQAIAGAPWQEICAGPMQVNNIAPSEVQAEVDRRMKLLGKAPTTPNPPAPPTPPANSSMRVRSHEDADSNQSDKATLKEIDSIRALLKAFLTLLDGAFKKVRDGSRPDHVGLESTRIELIQKLAPLKFGMECPELQRFLRSTAIELIATLKAQSMTQDELASFWDTKLPVVETVKAELELALSHVEQAFWDSAV